MNFLFTNCSFRVLKIKTSIHTCHTYCYRIIWAIKYCKKDNKHRLAFSFAVFAFEFLSGFLLSIQCSVHECTIWKFTVHFFAIRKQWNNREHINNHDIIRIFWFLETKIVNRCKINSHTLKNGIRRRKKICCVGKETAWCVVWWVEIKLVFLLFTILPARCTIYVSWMSFFFNFIFYFSHKHIHHFSNSMNKRGFPFVEYQCDDELKEKEKE